MSTLFKDAFTVGDLKSILSEMPDDTVIFQTNRSSGGYRKKISVLSIDNNNKHFDSWHRNIKVHQCKEDKIKGVNRDLKNIIIFGS